MEHNSLKRVILIKSSEFYWNVCSNPRWGASEIACNLILYNTCNEYAEYSNCGARHRMIRYEDLYKYIPDIKGFKFSWTLNPEDGKLK